MLKLRKSGKQNLRENVRYELRDREGNAKPIFQDNGLFTFLMKKGIVGPNFKKIPFLLGSWQTERIVSNLITNDGLAGVASRINGAGAEDAFTYIAIGTGTTAADVGDSTLVTETDREDATASRTTTTETDDTARLVHTFTFSESADITESGVLNAATDGTLLARQVFSAIGVQDGDSLQVTWDFQVEDGGEA